MIPLAIHGRPRGFINWQPRAHTAAVLENVQAVIEEYADFLPLTIRQIYYRMVGVYGYDKTEQAYGRLVELLNKARRARVIAFDAIRDDGFHKTEWLGWSGIDAAKQFIQNEARNFRLDRQNGQATRLVAWCEAQGMAPQLERVCEPFSISVYSSGGFDSLTVKDSVAQEFAALGSALVLHIGDHDPSGVHVFGSLGEDVRAFTEEAGGEFAFIRLAVTPQHIDAYNLPTAPPKPTDHRAFVGETVQAEALPPDVLAAILEEAILKHLDEAAYQTVLDQEANKREELVDWLGDRK
jgi:hypothetical protein